MNLHLWYILVDIFVLVVLSVWIIRANLRVLQH